jgi:hypothetical protein
MVKNQQLNCYTTNGRERQDIGFLQSKAIFPCLGTRIEERSQLTRDWIEGRNVGAFAPVTVNTSQSQVLNRGCTTMLFSNNVVNLVRQQHIIIVNATVFTATGGPLPN